jgi:hypothetical protein
MSNPARIDGDVVRVNWRLAEVLHQYRGLKPWKVIPPNTKHDWYIRAVKFRAAMIGRGLEVTPRFDTDTHERFEPEKLKYGSKGQIQCVHCGLWVNVNEQYNLPIINAVLIINANSPRPALKLNSQNHLH